jgi:hypothetical protein
MNKRKQGYQSILTGELGEVELQRLFLRWGWLPRKQLLDQGIDLTVELADVGRGLGLHFHVQSKASKGKLVGAADGIGLGLDRANVDYVLSQKNVVLLMFVSLHKTQAFWLDAQSAIRSANGKQDGSVYLKVPWVNMIDLCADDAALDAQRQHFITALQAAGMANISRAVSATEEELSALDPRCQVTLLVGSGQSRYEIALRDEVQLATTMTFPSPGEAEKLKEAIEYGVTRTFSVDSFDVSGSQLLERLLPTSRGQVTVGAHPGEPMDIFLGTRPRRGLDERIGKPLHMRGAIVRGLKGAHVSASAENHPLTCEVRVTPADGRADFTFGTNVASWEGRRLILLSGLAEAAESLERICAAGEIAIGFRSAHYQPSLTQQLSGDLAECVEVAATVLRQFDDLRDLAILYGKDVSIENPTRYSRSEPAWWHIARRIIDGETVSAPSALLTLRGEFSADVNKLIADQPKGVFFIKNTPLVVTAAGAEICTIPVDVSIEDYDVKVLSTVGSMTEIEMIRTGESKLLLRRSSDDPLQKF